MFFSVIIPAYNVASFLRRAVDSVLAQGMEPYGFEVILINDGSTDETGKICDEIAARHANFRVIHQENTGQAAARNAGLEVARGEYVIFLDGDDGLVPHAIKRLKTILDLESVDLLGFAFRIWKEGEQVPTISHIDYATDRKVEISELLPKTYFLPSVCAYIFRRDFIEKNPLRFVSGIYHEDEEFVARAVCLAEHGYFIDFPVYDYFQRSSSTMTTSRLSHRKKRIKDSRTVAEKLQEFQVEFPKNSPQWNYLRRQILIINYRIFRNLLNPDFEFLWSARMYSELKESALIPLPRGIQEPHYDFYARLTQLHVPLFVLRLLYRVILLTSRLRGRWKRTTA